MADLGICLFIRRSVCVAGSFSGRPESRPSSSEVGIDRDRSEFVAERGRCCLGHGWPTGNVEAVQ